jgi:hypothetical protein
MTYQFVRLSKEGTNSSFVARMFQGILEIQDLIIMTNNDPRNVQISEQQFFTLYEPIRSHLEIALKSSRDLNSICKNLIDDGLLGNLFKTYPDGGSELINTKQLDIQKEFDALISNSSIAIKTHLQRLLKEIYGFDIGFLFQKEKNFNEGLSNLELIDKKLITKYLQSVRKWTEQLINDIWNIGKHEYWRLNPIELKITKKPIVHVTLPKIFGMPIDSFAILTLNRCCKLVEDLIIYGFNNHRYSSIIIKEVPIKLRQKNKNRRFRAYPKTDEYILPQMVFIDEQEIT